MTGNLECPHCTGRPLYEGTQGSSALHGCGICGGVWIGNDLARRMFERLDMDAIALADLAARKSVPHPVPKREPKCPVCHGSLRRITVDQTLIEIDLCDAHGTWFDRYEFQAVARVLQKAPPTFDNFPEPLRFNPADYHRDRGDGSSGGGDGGWGFDFGDSGDSDSDGDGGDGGDGGGGGDGD
ncbi:zf-TFIIB domain-containing protein [Pendulispora rubella]|uniref:Zf-TFIIB domain-containing protein n=1 Tax=Pendulispora rubella TaxID=2741070 RepID=A0ABZ2L1E6_9BACT